jgi:hypothetical protein
VSHEPEFVTTNGRDRGPNDKVIVSCGIGPEYQEGLHSTRLHCEVHVPDAWRLFYRDYPEGCPAHSIDQYAFKIFALARAIAAGFRYVVWMDATFQPVADTEPMWEWVREYGWYIPRQGSAMLGTWCTDAFEKWLGIGAAVPTNRDLMMRIPLAYSGIVALDMHNPISRRIWGSWCELHSAGLFNGPHKNVPGLIPWRRWGLKWEGHCSYDPRCYGHRHDEAALSWVLHELGLEPPTTGFLVSEDSRGFIADHVPLCIPNWDLLQASRRMNAL